jgi:hypothetical protein
MLVLVVDNVIPALVFRAGGPGLGQDQPVGRLLVGVLAPPLGDHIGDVGDAGAEDERQPGRLDRALLASETIPASATIVTSGSWWAAINAVIVGSMVGGLGALPSNASTISGNPVASVNNPMVICGSRRRSLENPGSRNPSPASVSKYSVDTSNITSDVGPSAVCAAAAAANFCRQLCSA